MASVVQQKANTQGMWLAMDAKTRQGMALHVGDRHRRRAKRLWAKMPAASRQHATLYTDQYVVHAGVMPAAQHRAISQLRKTVNRRAVRGVPSIRHTAIRAWNAVSKGGTSC